MEINWYFELSENLFKKEESSEGGDGGMEIQDF